MYCKKKGRNQGAIFPGGAAGDWISVSLAGASGTEGAAVGLALGDGLLVFDLDVLGAAAAVHRVVLAGGDVAAHAGIGFLGREFHAFFFLS